LKGAERQLGIVRSETLDGVDGSMAVLLWQAHRAGATTALDTLLRYCLEDVVNLKPLLALTYNRLTSAFPIGITPIADDAPPAIAHTADPDLVRGLLQRRAWA
jgi:hypothetical protein